MAIGLDTSVRDNTRTLGNLQALARLQQGPDRSIGVVPRSPVAAVRSGAAAPHDEVAAASVTSSCDASPEPAGASHTSAPSHGMSAAAPVGRSRGSSHPILPEPPSVGLVPLPDGAMLWAQPDGLLRLGSAATVDPVGPTRAPTVLAPLPDGATLWAQPDGLLRLGTTTTTDPIGPFFSLAPASAPPPTAPAPSASSTQIAFVELQLADPLLQELISAYGIVQPTTLPDNATTDALVARYGFERTCRLVQASHALAAMHRDYTSAMDRAANAGPESGAPGWVLAAGTVPLGDADGIPATWRFDPSRFTADYAQGGGVAQRAFNTFLGDGFAELTVTLAGTSDAGDTHITTTPTAVGIDPNSARFVWEDIGDAGGMLRWDGARIGSHALAPVDLADPPEMFDPTLVSFHPSLGFVTANENLVPMDSTMETVVISLVVGAVTWGVGLEVCAGLDVAMASAQGGAVLGTVGSIVGGLFHNGTVRFDDVLRGAVMGGITGWVSQYTQTWGMANGQVVDWGERLQAALVNGGVQGLLTEITGGDFLEAFGSTFASGLAADIGRGLNASIAAALDRKDITADQAQAYTMLARVTTTAVGALGNPDAPLAAFAQDFLSELFRDEMEKRASNDPAELNFDGVIDGAVQDAGAGPWPGLEGGLGVDGAGRDGSGHLEESGGGVQAVGGDSTEPNGGGDHADAGIPQIVVTTRPLPVDHDGHRLEIDAHGHGFVHLMGGGIVGIGPLDPLLAANLTATAAYGGSFLAAAGATGGLVLGPGWGGSGGPSFGTGSGLPLGSAILTVARNPAFVVGLIALGTPGNGPMDYHATIQISGTERYVVAIDQLYGRIERLDDAGEWQTVQAGVQYAPAGDGQRFIQEMGQSHGQVQALNEHGAWDTVKTGVRLYADDGTGGFAILTDEERDRIRGPAINQPVVPGSPGTPGYAITDAQDIGTPGYAITEIRPATSTTTPIVEQHWTELVTHNNSTGGGVSGPAGNSVVAQQLDWTRTSPRTGGDAASHIQENHGSLSLTKPNQGIFYGDPVAVVEDAWQLAQQSGIAPVRVGNRDIYVVARPNSGYAGGMGGQLENFDHVTIITEAGTTRVVTAYPSGGTPPLPTGYPFTLGNP